MKKISEARFDWNVRGFFPDHPPQGEEEMIGLVEELQKFGCPFQLPFWLALRA